MKPFICYAPSHNVDLQIKLVTKPEVSNTSPTITCNHDDDDDVQWFNVRLTAN